MRQSTIRYLVMTELFEKDREGEYERVEVHTSPIFPEGIAKDCFYTEAFYRKYLLEHTYVERYCRVMMLTVEVYYDTADIIYDDIYDDYDEEYIAEEDMYYRHDDNEIIYEDDVKYIYLSTVFTVKDGKVTVVDGNILPFKWDSFARSYRSGGLF